GEFQEIEWDEALAIATGWLGDIRRTDPRKLAFFTGRDQSQALTGWWASQFGTPNYAAHGGFGSVNPVRTGYSAIADEWLGIRPGTDGLFVAALIHELLRAEKIDFAYLAR